MTKRYSGEPSPAESVGTVLRRYGIEVDPERLEGHAAALRSRAKLESDAGVEEIRSLASAVKKARRACQVVELLGFQIRTRTRRRRRARRNGYATSGTLNSWNAASRIGIWSVLWPGDEDESRSAHLRPGDCVRRPAQPKRRSILVGRPILRLPRLRDSDPADG